jgi:hypothetical protein
MHVDERDEVSLVAQQQKRQNLDVLVAHGSSLLLVPWQPHVFIGKINLGLQRPVTD